MLKVKKSWVIFYGRLAYNGSWETEDEAERFLDNNHVQGVTAEIAQVEMYVLELGA